MIIVDIISTGIFSLLGTIPFTQTEVKGGGVYEKKLRKKIIQHYFTPYHCYNYYNNKISTNSLEPVQSHIFWNST